MIVKQVVGHLSTSEGDSKTFNAIMRFGNGWGYKISLGRLPAILQRPLQIVFDLEICENEGTKLVAGILEVRTTTWKFPGPNSHSMMTTEDTASKSARTVVHVAANELVLPSAEKQLQGEIDAGNANRPAPLEVLQQGNLKASLSNKNYFLLIAHAIEQLLLQPQEHVKLAESLNSLTFLKTFSLESFEQSLRAEPGLFAISDRAVVSLQPAGATFVENFLALCPSIYITTSSSWYKGPRPELLPASDVPQHLSGAYNKLFIRAMLQMKHKQWRAHFTFRQADDCQRLVFWIHVKNNNHIITMVRKIQISLDTDEGSKLSLKYQFIAEVEMDKTELQDIHSNPRLMTEKTVNQQQDLINMQMPLINTSTLQGMPTGMPMNQLSWMMANQLPWMTMHPLQGMATNHLQMMMVNPLSNMMTNQLAWIPLNQSPGMVMYPMPGMMMMANQPWMTANQLLSGMQSNQLAMQPASSHRSEGGFSLFTVHIFNDKDCISYQLAQLSVFCYD